MNTKWFNKKLLSFTGLIAAAALILAACAPVSNSPSVPVATSAPAATAVPATAVMPEATAVPTAAPSASAASAEAVVALATDPKLGQVLVDGKGMTLYVFAKDGPDQPTCVGGCAKVWPALLSQGKPQAGTGVDASMLGTAKQADGTLIVTYNHKPLYYFAKDTKPGDVLGQGVGNVWFALAPSGQAIGEQSLPVTGGTSAPAAGNPTSAPAAATSAPSASSEATVKVVTDPKLGQILVDGTGMTLYMFKKDTPDQSNCSVGCLKVWPPLLSQGKPVAGAGVDASMLGTAKLADGSLIVTYNHMPLYHYASDVNPGDTTGQGVGTIWFVVGPNGKPVTTVSSGY